MTSERSPAYQPCPVARSVDIIGDRWALLIVRDAFDGVRRFGDFQRGTGMARNILTDRLRKLVEAGIFATQPASDGTAYQEYVLTQKGNHSFRLSSHYVSGAKAICLPRANRIRCWWIHAPVRPSLRWPRSRLTAKD